MYVLQILAVKLQIKLQNNGYTYYHIIYNDILGKLEFVSPYVSNSTPPPLFFVGDYDAWLLYIFAESRLIHRETLIVLTIPPNYLRAV